MQHSLNVKFCYFIVQEKIEAWLTSVRVTIERMAKKKGPDFVLDTGK